MPRCARIVPFLALVLCPLAASAQTEPLDVELQGDVTFGDPAFTVLEQGDRYTLALDLNLDISGPASTGANASAWDTFGLVTLRRDGSLLHSAIGPCVITIDNDTNGTGESSIQLVFDDADPSDPDRDYHVTLFADPGDGPLDINSPPTASAINALQNSINAANFTALFAVEPDDGGPVVTIEATIDTVSATGYNGDSAPEITAQPTSAQIATQGDTVVLSVAADGPDLAYEWQRDGVPVTDNAFTSGSATSTLTLTARPGDTGVYECVVTNTFGSATSDQALLGVRTTCRADQNADNVATPADFTAWIANFNLGC